MSKYKIFKGTEFDGKEGVELQQISQQIKSKFDQKRNRYHQLRNQIVINDEWDEFNDKLTDFDADEFARWNQKWNSIARGTDPAELKKFFNEGMVYFAKMDDFVNGITITQNNRLEVEALKAVVLKQIESDMLNLKTDVTSKISDGIQDLIGLKAELKLHGNFQTNINDELGKSTTSRNRFLIFFISFVFSIPLFLVSTYVFDVFTTLSYRELMFLRGSVTISAAVLSYFFYSQYKLYQLICLRYTHLNGFLGGGATFVNQLIGSEDKAKHDINRKMAELFMELDDVFGLVKKNQHPAEASLEKAGDMIDKIANLASKVTKTS